MTAEQILGYRKRSTSFFCVFLVVLASSFILQALRIKHVIRPLPTPLIVGLIMLNVAAFFLYKTSIWTCPSCKSIFLPKPTQWREMSWTWATVLFRRNFEAMAFLKSCKNCGVYFGLLHSLEKWRLMFAEGAVFVVSALSLFLAYQGVFF